MFKPKTYIEVCMAMQTRAVVCFQTSGEIDNIIGIVNGIEAEDGSGRNWNINIVLTEDCISRGKKEHKKNETINFFWKE